MSSWHSRLDSLQTGLFRLFVDLDLDAVRTDRSPLAVRELEPVDPVRKETLAAAEDRREHHQPELVDEVVLEQRIDERAAARDQDRPFGLVPELLQPAYDVARDDRRVLPLRIGQPVRDDVLRVVVELVRERTLARRPGRREAFVRHSAEELDVSVHQLVELELVAVVAPVVLEGPASVLVVLRAARILEDAVERDEFGDNDPA